MSNIWKTIAIVLAAISFIAIGYSVVSAVNYKKESINFVKIIESLRESNKQMQEKLTEANAEKDRVLNNYDNYVLEINKQRENEIMQEIIRENRYAVHKNYLWHGNKKLLEDELTVFIKDKNVDDFGEWFRYEENNKIYIFLKGGTGGAWTIDVYHLEINKNNDSVQLRTNNDLSGLGLAGKAFPKKRIIVYNDYPFKESITPPKAEEIYTYDLVAHSKKKILTLKENETTLVCGHSCYLGEELVTLDNNLLTVRVMKKGYNPWAETKENPINEYKINL